MFRRIESHNLADGNQDFLEYLATDECQDALERYGISGISIHVPTEDIFINNENTSESLYTFLNNQQDTTKKEIPPNFTYDDDLMTKYLPAINEFDEVKHDFLTNKNSKFLFHLFNKYQQDRGKTKYPIRHSVLTDDHYTLKKLQERNWPYFINRIIEFSQGFINLADETDQTEINILTRTRSNFEIVKNFYKELFNSVGINLHHYFRNLGIVERQRINTDLTNHDLFTWDPQEQFIQERILTTY